MGLWDRLRGELIDVIGWTQTRQDTMVHRFERYGNEIKYGAILTVREGQVAVFVNEGEVTDVFEPGTYELETANLPLLSSLQSWRHGFESPFKAEVYFVSTTRFPDLKWGTKNPVMLRDPEFGPVRLRAFGTYEIAVLDPVLLLQEVVGTDPHFSVDEISDQLRNEIVSRLAGALGAARIPVLDLAANYEQLGQIIGDKINPYFEAYGLELTRLLIENISLPPKVEEALDKRTSMGLIGDLSAYMQYQAAESMGKGGDGGMAGMGAGMGAGLAMGQQMAAQMAGAFNPYAGVQAPRRTASTPPPPPPASIAPLYHVAKNGQTFGPYTQHVLAQQAVDGSFTKDTQVWSEGMAGWQAAGQVDSLKGLFSQTPPPPPAAA